MKKILIITGVCIVLVIVVYLSFNNNKFKNDPRGSLYAGTKACAKCHSNIYDSYLHTAHYLASLPASKNTVHGSFDKSSNVFSINDSQKILMEKFDSNLYQNYYLNGKIKDQYHFDIVFGGVKGESYLYWKGNELYQLPLSYFNFQNEWSTSPGYGFDFLNYPKHRSIGKQCMECHASYIDNTTGESQGFNKEEQFDKATLVYSIDCERCHGPGGKHVEFQTGNPEIKIARFITSYSSLNRVQRMDMCAVCHSGKPTVKLRSSFEFVPGDTFAKFKMPEFYHANDTSQLDVHGNQLQLLQSSKCYKFSKMDCATCHDVHQNTRNNDSVYIQKCFNCHNTENHIYCKMTNKLTADVLNKNCINCHMPSLPTKAISVQVSDKVPAIQFFVHTHHITTYPQEVKKILAYINK